MFKSLGFLFLFLIYLWLSNFQLTFFDDKLVNQRRFTVEVKGAVRYPGLYDFKNGDNLETVLKLAEPLKDAGLETVNLAALLEPEAVIVIPYKQVGKLVSINSADKAELMTLKGIKESLAEAIIAYRQKHGGFKSLTELKAVKGIGEKKFQQLKTAIKL